MRELLRSYYFSCPSFLVLSGPRESPPRESGSLETTRAVRVSGPIGTTARHSSVAANCCNRYIVARNRDYPRNRFAIAAV